LLDLRVYSRPEPTCQLLVFSIRLRWIPPSLYSQHTCIHGPGSRVQGSGFRVQGSGSRVQGSGLGGCTPESAEGLNISAFATCSVPQARDSVFFIPRSDFFAPCGVLLYKLVTLGNVDGDTLKRDLVGSPRSNRVNHLDWGLVFSV
jgi:hypothetical protein